MMKFRVTDPLGSNSRLSESNDITSSTVNLTSKFLKPNKSRRNSLIVEETGRFGTRRSSAPPESFIPISEIRYDNYFWVQDFRFKWKYWVIFSSNVQILRFNRSNEDVSTEIDPFPTTQNDIWGQTSESFVFNALRKSKSSNALHSNQKATEEISYRGFTNFDEIALTDNINQEANVLDDISDSGVGSINSINSNYLKLKPLQTMSDLADIGMQSWRSNFTLANLRKRYFYLNSFHCIVNFQKKLDTIKVKINSIFFTLQALVASVTKIVCLIDCLWGPQNQLFSIANTRWRRERLTS